MTEALEQVWPEVSARLTAQLRRRGVGQADCEDLVQECAVRLLRSPVPFTDAEDLLRWCSTVVRNLHVDLTRRPTAEPLPVGLDLADHTDVPRTVTARLLLSEVTAAWPQLTERDRWVLADSSTAAGRPEQLRLGTARRRARARLQALLTGALGGVGLCALPWRRVALTTAPALVLSTAFLLVPLAPFGSPALPEPALTRLPPAAAAPVAARVSAAPKEGALARATVLRTVAGASPPVPSRPQASDRRPVARAELPSGDSVAVSHRPNDGHQPIVRVCADTVPVTSEACVSVGPFSG